MFNLILQLHGGKGTTSTTTVQSYEKTPEEREMDQLSLQIAKDYYPNITKLNESAGNILYNSLGDVQYDYSSALQQAQNQINASNNTVNALTQGQLPQAYLDNMQTTLNKSVQNSLGTALNSLGTKGVVNSSVMNRGIQGISDSAADAMANAYTTNISTLSQLAGQQNDQATSSMTAAAAAQEAAQQPALNLWNASLGLTSSNQSTMSALAGKGTTTATGTQSNNSYGLLGGALTGLATGWGSNTSGIFCFTDDTKIKTPSGEKLIRHIRQGDVITCPNEDGTDTDEVVIEVQKPRDENVYIVSCGDVSVATTLSQPFLDTNGEWVEVKDLHLGSHLTVGDVTGIFYSGVRKVYDLRITGSNNYYANGFKAKGMLS